jgi:hypothetical protein
VAALLPFIISKFNLFTNLIKRNGWYINGDI